MPGALVGNRDPALGQNQLGNPQDGVEDMIKPYGVADDFELTSWQGDPSKGGLVVTLGDE